MKKTLIISSLVGVAAFLPMVASAAAINNVSDIGTFIINFINNVVVPVVFALAFIVFLYGVFDAFILGAGSPDKRSQGISIILYSLIGFFVMVSIWGLVNILSGTFSFGNNTGPATGYPSANVHVTAP